MKTSHVPKLQSKVSLLSFYCIYLFILAYSISFRFPIYSILLTQLFCIAMMSTKARMKGWGGCGSPHAYHSFKWIRRCGGLVDISTGCARVAIYLKSLDWQYATLIMMNLILQLQVELRVGYNTVIKLPRISCVDEIRCTVSAVQRYGTLDFDQDPL